jgi:hypothetical protein
MTISDIFRCSASYEERVSLVDISEALGSYPDEQVIEAIKRAAALIHRAEEKAKGHAPGCDICGRLLCDGDDHR